MTTIAFALPADLVADLGAEVLDHHLRLLRDVVRVQRHEARELRGRLLLVDLRVVLDRLDQPVVRLVGRVVLEHVEDEALLDGLPHRVEVERDRACPPRLGARRPPASWPWAWR